MRTNVRAICYLKMCIHQTLIVFAGKRIYIFGFCVSAVVIHQFLLLLSSYFVNLIFQQPFTEGPPHDGGLCCRTGSREFENRMRSCKQGKAAGALNVTVRNP
jgi:hypothetical protein